MLDSSRPRFRWVYDEHRRGSPTIVGVDTVRSGVTEVADPYVLGDFAGIDIWLDPANGDDTNDGHDQAHAMRTIGAAWRKIPAGRQLDTGYRLRLTAGRYPQATSVAYWENRHGTDRAPIIIEAADGVHTATFEVTSTCTVSATSR